MARTDLPDIFILDPDYGPDDPEGPPTVENMTPEELAPCGHTECVEENRARAIENEGFTTALAEVGTAILNQARDSASPLAQLLDLAIEEKKKLAGPPPENVGPHALRALMLVTTLPKLVSWLEKRLPAGLQMDPRGAMQGLLGGQMPDIGQVLRRIMEQNQPGPEGNPEDGDTPGFYL